MTNRTTQRPYSAGTAIKRPRLRRLEILFDGPPPNTPEGLSNGTRPHGGFRGMKQLPPGQFSYDKDEAYASELNEEYQVLVNSENLEHHGAPFWVNDVQREITHSGESPLFTNKILPTGKFEQLHGCVNFERALLSTKTKRPSSPRRRHINGIRQYYRPNSTHQYLSATDLRNMHENEENMIKYGRPTRTTLLRARQRSNSAPVNAYDLRRESTKRIEEVKNNTIFCTSKEMYNLYATDGETMHSFLTGARYNRAHLIDSRGLTEYGIYMPRENPTDCFITANRRAKEAGDDIPSAPPDSPRSDLDENTTQTIITRPMSGVVHYRPVSTVRPGSSKAGNGSKATSSRPQSHRITSSKSPGSRPRSGKDSIASSFGQSTRSLPAKSAESNRRDPLPDEITMAMPDHINRTGRGGVYVTLKGQRMLETVESKLPRVTGVSLPKIRKSRDHVDEMALVNQPPPTPIDASMAGVDKTKHTDDNIEDNNAKDVETDQKADVVEDVDVHNKADEAIGNQTANTQNINKTNNETEKEIIALNISKLTVSKNVMIERETIEIGPTKHVNFSANEVTVITDNADNATSNETREATLKEPTGDDGKDKPKAEQLKHDDEVKFFVTEEAGDSNEMEAAKDKNGKAVESSDNPDNKNKDNDNDDGNENELGEKNVDHVIKVEISETEKAE